MIRATSLLTALVGVLATLALLVAGTAPASAATVTGGDADWGIKASFRNYIENGPGAGTITASDGATRNADGTFNFQPGSGTYAPATGEVDATFGGQVFFTGHGDILRVTVTNPRISYAGSTGTLYADVVSTEPFGPNAGTEHQYPNVDFATLDLSGVTPVDDGATLTVAGIPAKLTANGAEAFAGFYPAGTALDPVSFELTYAPGTITRGEKKAEVGHKGGKVTLGKVGCDSATCKVKAPKKLTAKIKGGDANGTKVKLAVKAPSELDQGARGKVTVKLKKATAGLLTDGNSLKLSAEVTLKGDGNPVTEKLTVKAVPK